MGLFGEGTALAENLGVDLGQVTESLGVAGTAENLPGGLGDVAGDALIARERTSAAMSERTLCGRFAHRRRRCVTW
ncbi:MAG TPA: hypothetical protein VK860_00430 [Ilumatobacteraceae bacterium]|nr:hypothetical protein [Ilumatobacteraceae bacterium]